MTANRTPNYEQGADYNNRWSGLEAAKIPGAIDELAYGKANKIASPTAGKLLVSDSDGDMVESAKTITDFAGRAIPSVGDSIAILTATTGELKKSDSTEKGLTVATNTIEAKGSDTNIDINLTPKGSGSVVMPKVDINGGTVDGADITVGSGKTLDVSGGTLTLADGQVAAAKTSGLVAKATTYQIEFDGADASDGAVKITPTIATDGAALAAGDKIIMLQGFVISTGLPVALPVIGTAFAQALVLDDTTAKVNQLAGDLSLNHYVGLVEKA